MREPWLPAKPWLGWWQATQAVPRQRAPTIGEHTDAILRDCSLDKVEWERANLSRADLRGSTISGLNLAMLSGYAGLMIGESQQMELLERLGVIVSPD
mgnify:CR=1 FL=1